MVLIFVDDGNSRSATITVTPKTTSDVARKSKFWIFAKMALLVWLPVSIVSLHLFAFRVIRMFFNSPLDIWLLGNVSVYTLSAVSLDAIVLFRTKIRKTFDDVIENTFKDARNPEKLIKKWKLYLVLTAIYVLSMTCVTVSMSQIKCGSKRVSNWWMTMIMFGSDVGHNWSATTKCLFMAIDNLLCGICLMGCCPLLASGLVALSLAVEEMVDSFSSLIREYASGESGVTSEDVRELRRRYDSILSTVDKINDTCKNFVLLWSVLALESACFSITVSLKRYGSESYETLGSSVYYIAKYGQPVVILIALILIASAIPDKLSRCYKLFRGITPSNSSGPMTDRELAAYNSDVLILRHQFQGEIVGLSAGDCFLLTKNFCLSFIGLGVTYVILLIQFQSVIEVR